MGRHSYHKRDSTFVLEGRFLGFNRGSEGKLKYFSLATAEGEIQLKLAKPLRWTVGPQLAPGEWITVQGEQKLSKYGDIKRKVWDVRSAGVASIVDLDVSSMTSSEPASEEPVSQNTQPKPSLGCIQICRKSDCCKRGGVQVLRALEQAVNDHPERERIHVKPIGCIKKCKAGPNLVIMPGRARYSNVSPEDVPHLIQQHFPTPAQLS